MNIPFNPNELPELHKHIINKNYDDIKKMIDDGYDINTYSKWGISALHYAPVFSLDITKLLVENGANINTPNRYGSYPIHVSTCNYEICKYLLDNNSIVNPPGANGVTPLHLAAFQGEYQTVKLLLERNADPLALTASRESPLDRAYKRKEGHQKENIIKCLIDATDISDRAGEKRCQIN